MIPSLAISSWVFIGFLSFHGHVPDSFPELTVVSALGFTISPKGVHYRIGQVF
jgi:hypothetical protein